MKIQRYEFIDRDSVIVDQIVDITDQIAGDGGSDQDITDAIFAFLHNIHESMPTEVWPVYVKESLN